MAGSSQRLKDEAPHLALARTTTNFLNNYSILLIGHIPDNRTFDRYAFFLSLSARRNADAKVLRRVSYFAQVGSHEVASSSC